MVGNRIAEQVCALRIDRAAGTAHRAPDAARIPVDPALWYRVGRSPGWIGRGNAEHLEAAHRPQPLGELAIVEPAPMPFVASADVRVEDDRERDHDLRGGEVELVLRRHECAEA